MKKPFLNLAVDHMTLLVDSRFYPVAYAVFRVVFGVGAQDILYEKRKRWPGSDEETSMTFAVRLGSAPAGQSKLSQAIVAVVQPSEPESRPSHVRQILSYRGGSAHWQHIALRTPDLLKLHEHCLARGVNFITPVIKDEDEDLIQVFSGEWIVPGAKPSGLFFEFVQRNPGKELLKKLAARDRQAWFRDETFLGLYAEKESEYQRGRAVPFIDDALFEAIERTLGPKPVWKITAGDLSRVEKAMMAYAASKRKETEGSGKNKK